MSAESSAQEELKILAFIGARGGSKGLKGKNLLDFGGKPLIQWTIEAALQSEFITDVVVSTDDDRIRTFAGRVGARTPFSRPAELAEDRSDINDAIVHAIEWLSENEDRSYDLVVLLQPTQPLRDVNLIDRLMQDYLETGCHLRGDSLVTVTKADAKAAYLMQAQGAYIDFALRKETLSSNRQETPEYYYPAGAMYVAPVAEFLKAKSFYGERTRFAEVDREAATDIDTAEDMEVALRIFKQRGLS